MQVTLNDMGRKKPKAESTPSHETQPKAGTDTVRIERDLAEKINIAARVLRTSVSDILSPYLREFINEKFQEARRKMEQYGTDS